MIHQLTAAELAAKLKAREFSCREVTEAFLARIGTEDGHYGAYLHVDREGALRQADDAQKMLDSGTAGPLTGVPLAVKDNISTKGVPTTCASKILEGYVPPYDATVIEKCRAGGMVVLGKTNLDEFAMGASTETSAYQLTRNPWDTDRVPGGSSGGSAVAVSAELAAVSLGSDTGGSVRQPGSLTGVVGFKPSYGRVSRYGLVAFASSLDQIGPFGKSVEDAALMASVVSGHDPMDSTSQPLGGISTQGLREGSVKGLKVGVIKELMGDDVSPGVRESVEISLDQLKREGADLVEVSLPSITYGVTTYYIIAPSEASSNLARFDGVRYGPRVESDGHIESFMATRGRLFGPEVKLRIMVGTYALSAGYYDAYYHKAQQVRGMMAEEFEAALRDVEVLACPTSPVVAFKFGEIQDPIALKMLDMCTIPANMGGFPSISLPCGLADDLPVGLLLTSGTNTDERLLQVSHSVERALGREYRRPPIV